jgi:glutamate-ammonia-ligase adenylyltransferase
VAVWGDVEWTVQLLQLRHAHEVPGLRTTGTLTALAAALSAGLVSGDDAGALRDSWRLASRVRNALMLVRARPSDSLPRDAGERAGVAFLCGYPAQETERLADDYRRVTRRARSVVERIFSG